MGMKKMYSLALAYAAMATTLSTNSVSDEKYEPKPHPMPKFDPRVFNLSGVRHIGPIPKGCQLQQCEIIAAKGRYHISIIVDIVAMNNKTFNKKLIAMKNHVSSYIAVTSIEKLLTDKRFVLTEMIKEDGQAVEDAGLKG